MTKRFRQASLSFENLAVAVEDSEDLQVQQGGGGGRKMILGRAAAIIMGGKGGEGVGQLFKAIIIIKRPTKILIL